MKRDMDIVREVLLTMESCKNGKEQEGVEKLIDVYPEDDVRMSIGLLYDIDYITGVDVTAGNENIKHILVSGITWDGYEFLEEIRNNKIWDKAKEKFGPLLSIPTEVLRIYLVELIKTNLGLT